MTPLIDAPDYCNCRIMLSRTKVRFGGLCVKSLFIFVEVRTDSLIGNRLEIRITLKGDTLHVSVCFKSTT